MPDERRAAAVALHSRCDLLFRGLRSTPPRRPPSDQNRLPSTHTVEPVCVTPTRQPRRGSRITPWPGAGPIERAQIGVRAGAPDSSPPDSSPRLLASTATVASYRPPRPARIRNGMRSERPSDGKLSRAASPVPRRIEKPLRQPPTQRRSTTGPGDSYRFHRRGIAASRPTLTSWDPR